MLKPGRKCPVIAPETAPAVPVRAGHHGRPAEAPGRVVQSSKRGSTYTAAPDAPTAADTPDALHVLAPSGAVRAVRVAARIEATPSLDTSTPAPRRPLPRLAEAGIATVRGAYQRPPWSGPPDAAAPATTPRGARIIRP